MWEFARANQEPLAIHCWAVFQFNIVQLIINVRPEQFAELAFARQCVHQIANVFQINYVYKEFVNPHAMTIQHALISNSVRTMCARKRFDAIPMMIVRSTNIAKLIHTADLNVKMLVKDGFYADEMLNVRLETIRDRVHVNKVLSMMVKMDAVELNANATMNVVQINSVKRIFVNWPVKVVDRVVKKPFVPLKTIVQYAIVNRDTVEIHMNNVMPLIIVVIHRADQALSAPITKEHSIVHAVMDSLVIHIMKVVA